MNNSILPLFSDLDDFCQTFEPTYKTRQLESGAVHRHHRATLALSEKTSSFIRDGYNFPVRKNAIDFDENTTLSGDGEILFFGYRDAPVFVLKYFNHGDEFEGSFDGFYEKGDVTQTLALWE